MQRKSHHAARHNAERTSAKTQAALSTFEAKTVQQSYRYEQREELSAAKHILEAHLKAQAALVSECLTTLRIAAYAAAAVSIIEAISHLIR